MSHARATANDKPEPFPTLSPVASSNVDPIESSAIHQDVPQHRGTSSAYQGRRSSNRKSRTSSLLQSMLESSPPLGAWQAIGEDTAKGPTIPDIRRGGYSAEGWSHEGQLEQRNHKPHDIHRRRLSRASSSQDGRSISQTTPATPNPRAVVEETTEPGLPAEKRDVEYLDLSKEDGPLVAPRPPVGPNEEGEYPNGYRFPKKHTWSQSCAIYGRAFWKFFLTVKGFLLTIYGLNVVAWGAMIFFLLIPGATPAMCKSYPDCDDKRYSARQLWIEYCSQILTALFCVTAFGLLPWRLRDFYYMIKYQAFGDYSALRKLAGFYRGWYRLPGSEKLPELLGPPQEPADLQAKSLFSLKQWHKQAQEHDAEKFDVIDDEITALNANPAVPLPVWSMPPAPLTGIRARPTKFKALAWIIWMYIWNTLFQVGLCVVMWGYNRFERNTGYFTALTALFIVLGCGTGIVAGIITGREGKAVKGIEGIPVKDYDVPETPQDYQQRIAKKNKKEKRKQGDGAVAHTTKA